MLHRPHSTSSYGRCQCADRCYARHRTVCSSSHNLGIISEPPQFDVPERQPTLDEASSIAAGAKLTPEQQLAQKLQLPITQPVHLPPGAPNPRQLMQRIKAAKTWQELEAAVYQKQELLALQQNTQTQQQEKQQQRQGRLEPPSAQPLQQGLPVGPPITPSQAEQQQQQQQPEQTPQQQQQQQQQPPEQPSVQQQPPPVQAARKQRRKQPVPLLNVTSTSLQLGLSGSAGVTQPTPAMSPVLPPTGDSSSSSSSPGVADLPSNTPQQRLSAAPTAQQLPQSQVLTVQQQEYRQQPLLNALHVCEALRKLPALLPQQQGQLLPSERQRVAQLIMHLCQVALQHASDLSFDTRGLAHVLTGLSKLGHRDEALLAELQLAALLAVQDFSSRHAAMLLAAFATMGVRPQAEMLQALQQHISNTLGLFEGQSLSTTIWALAKLQDMATAQAKLSPQSSTPDQGPSGGSRSAGAGAAAAATVAGGQGVPVVPRQLVQSLLWRCNPQMHHWSGRDIAQAAWGLAKLGARPNATWRQALLAAAEPKLGNMNVQDLTNLLSALPTLRALPEPAWLDTLCSVAATKLWLAAPLGVYNLLMGLLRLKQVQHKAAKTAAKRQQLLLQEQNMQQQGQQWQEVGEHAGSPGDSQEQDAAQQLQQQPQDISPIAEGLGLDEARRGVAAANQELPTGNNQSPHALTGAAGGDAVGTSASSAVAAAASPCAGTLAELRLLKVAAQWLQTHPKALHRWQLAGVICAFGELLPESRPAREEQHVQSASPGAQVESGTLHKGDASATCVQGPEQKAWERARGSLLGVLQQMVPAWAEEIEGMAKGMGKGRKSRYLQLKWAELLSKCGQASPE